MQAIIGHWCLSLCAQMFIVGTGVCMMSWQGKFRIVATLLAT